MNYISQLYIVCLFVRIGFMYLAYLSIQYNKYYQMIAIGYAIMGCGFFVQWINKSRKKGAFNQTIWWDYLRPFHGFMLFIAAYLIYQKNILFIPTLLLDTIVGIHGHLQFHYL